MTVVLDEPALEQHLARIDDEGFTIIEDAVRFAETAYRDAEARRARPADS